MRHCRTLARIQTLSRDKNFRFDRACEPLGYRDKTLSICRGLPGRPNDTKGISISISETDTDTDTDTELRRQYQF